MNNESGSLPIHPVIGAMPVESFTPALDIVDVSQEARSGKLALEIRLQAAEGRLAKRRTGKISRLFNLLSRVNRLRGKLNLRELTLGEFRQGLR